MTDFQVDFKADELLHENFKKMSIISKIMFRKWDVQFGSQKLRFPRIFCLWSLRKRILQVHVLSYKAIVGTRILFQKVSFSWKATESCCFHRITNANQDEIAPRMEVSVAEWLSFQVSVVL